MIWDENVLSFQIRVHPIIHERDKDTLSPKLMDVNIYHVCPLIWLFEHPLTLMTDMTASTIATLNCLLHESVEKMASHNAFHFTVSLHWGYLVPFWIFIKKKKKECLSEHSWSRSGISAVARGFLDGPVVYREDQNEEENEENLRKNERAFKKMRKWSYLAYLRVRGWLWCRPECFSFDWWQVKRFFLA